MATVEQAATDERHHGGAGSPSRTRRPARSSRTSRTCAPRRSREMAASARAPRSPAGRRWASTAVRASCCARRSGCIDNAERVIETIVIGDRQVLRGRAARRDLLRRQRVRVLGQERREVPRRREGQVRATARQGQEADGPLPAARPDRRHRPVELPADELLRRLHPGADGGQQRDPQALGGHAADVAADGRGAARVRPARERLPGRRPATARPAPRWSTRST